MTNSHTTDITLRRLAGVLFAGTLLFAACGDDDADVSSDNDELPTDDGGGADDETRPVGSDEDFGPAGEPPTAGMCAEDEPDCEDTVSSGDDDQAGQDDSHDEAAYIREAEELLGTPEAELDTGTDLRIGRRGEEQYMLTEDYVIGRMTVELDENEDGVFVVTRVTVELTEGPHVVE